MKSTLDQVVVLGGEESSSLEEEINALYQKVHRLAEEAISDPLKEVQYQKCLAHLHKIQNLEAERMKNFADSQRHLSPSALEEEIAHIKSLLPKN